MIEIRGNYAAAKVFCDELEETARQQIQTLCDQPFVSDSKIRIMPDVHAGAGCTIGTTMTIADKVVPNLVGVDIGCGMETVRLREKEISFEKLDRVIRIKIPSGMEVRKRPHTYRDAISLDQLHCKKSVDVNRAALSIGTLGGGNHFIEVDKDENENLYLVVHSGSRHLGKQIAAFYQKEAVRDLKEKNVVEIPPQLAYAEGPLFRQYMHDMELAQEFAQLNRNAITEVILREMNLTAEDRFTTVHNYIDTQRMILRKGAVSASLGEPLLVPINMRDGSLICMGKGNPDWNSSAPHGAGRLMSRTEAKHQFSVREFKREMKGIYSTTISDRTLDECPMAYKDMDHILSNIAPTAQVISRIRPVYNYKAE